MSQLLATRQAATLAGRTAGLPHHDGAERTPPTGVHRRTAGSPVRVANDNAVVTSSSAGGTWRSP